MWYRLGLVAMCALIVALLAALPMAIMARRAVQVRSRQKASIVSPCNRASLDNSPERSGKYCGKWNSGPVTEFRHFNLHCDRHIAKSLAFLEVP